eukprot:4845742-Amphidinium_carterae.1
MKSARGSGNNTARKTDSAVTVKASRGKGAKKRVATSMVLPAIREKPCLALPFILEYAAPIASLAIAPARSHGSVAPFNEVRDAGLAEERRLHSVRESGNLGTHTCWLDPPFLLFSPHLSVSGSDRACEVCR